MSNSDFNDSEVVNQPLQNIDLNMRQNIGGFGANNQ